jgi:hypothetical protein
MMLPLDSIASATADEDVLSISFVSGQPDLVLKVCRTPAHAEQQLHSSCARHAACHSSHHAMCQCVSR